MGQALFDAMADFLKLNKAYDDTSLSPFLLVSSFEDDLYRLEANSEPRPDDERPWSERMETPNPAAAKWHPLMTEKYPLSSLLLSETIEQVEDHYLGQAETRARRPHEWGWCVFHLNAQTSSQGFKNRRGGGWIAMMHPDTFADIEHLPSVPQFRDSPPLWTTRGDLTIGRWTLAATKPDRYHHVWTSTHLTPGDVYTAYRATDVRNRVDGLSIAATPEGFRYPADEPRPGGYLVRTTP